MGKSSRDQMVRVPSESVLRPEFAFDGKQVEAKMSQERLLEFAKQTEEQSSRDDVYEMTTLIEAATSENGEAA